MEGLLHEINLIYIVKEQNCSDLDFVCSKQSWNGRLFIIKKKKNLKIYICQVHPNESAMLYTSIKLDAIYRLWFSATDRFRAIS